MEHHENDGKSRYGGRDLIGYGNNAPDPKWPKRAKVALNFVINFEEGGEECLLHGDDKSEGFMGETPRVGGRNVNAESQYDYGSRAGFWRLFKLFNKKKLPCTVFATGMALERNPAISYELHKCEDIELSCHGYRSIDYQHIDEETQRKHIQHAIEIHKNYLGNRPPGFYQGKPNPDTRGLIVSEGGFKYDSDSYADDLPYWNLDYRRPHLVIPYSMTENDIRFEGVNGFTTADQFSKHLKDTLKSLIEEGRSGSPKMMSVGLHCRLAQPARATALAEFMDYAKGCGREVWICTREEIANHWIKNHFPRGRGSRVVPIEEVKDTKEEDVSNEKEEEDKKKTKSQGVNDNDNQEEGKQKEDPEGDKEEGNIVEERKEETKEKEEGEEGIEEEDKQEGETPKLVIDMVPKNQKRTFSEDM